jgi:lactoylglutathione lyase
MSSEAQATQSATAPERARLGWVIVYVPSVEQALAFYERAFALPRKFIAEGGSFGELDTGQTTLAFASEELAGSNLAHGFQRAAPDAPPCNVELCLVFDDVAAAFTHAVASGATALAAPAVKPWGQTVAYLRDPFGTLVELASPLA